MQQTLRKYRESPELLAQDHWELFSRCVASLPDPDGEQLASLCLEQCSAKERKLLLAECLSHLDPSCHSGLQLVMKELAANKLAYVNVEEAQYAARVSVAAIAPHRVAPADISLPQMQGVSLAADKGYYTRAPQCQCSTLLCLADVLQAMQSRGALVSRLAMGVLHEPLGAFAWSEDEPLPVIQHQTAGREDTKALERRPEFPYQDWVPSVVARFAQLARCNSVLSEHDGGLLMLADMNSVPAPWTAGTVLRAAMQQSLQMLQSHYACVEVKALRLLQFRVSVLSLRGWMDAEEEEILDFCSAFFELVVKCPSPSLRRFSLRVAEDILDRVSEECENRIMCSLMTSFNIETVRVQLLQRVKARPHPSILRAIFLERDWSKVDSSDFTVAALNLFYYLQGSLGPEFFEKFLEPLEASLRQQNLFLPLLTVERIREKNPVS